ncbi:MAG: hypothetical protein ABIE25_06335 [Thermoplasmatota archaeon]
MAKNTRTGQRRRKDANKTSPKINASRVDEAEYDCLFMQTTGASSDMFLDKHLEMLRRLNKLSIASFSYRIGMADILRAVEKDLGKEKAELVLRALERENHRRRVEPALEYVDDEGVGSCEDDELEDREDDDPTGHLISDWRRRANALRRMQRRPRRDGFDPMFG